MTNAKSAETNNIPYIEEEFEDADEDSSEELEAYKIATPYKDRQLITNPFDFIVKSLTDQIRDGTLILADKFQRRQVWNNVKCSRLIESLLINVPIPVCYFAELEKMQYSVIDGQQRLSAIYRFLNNEYPLKGLKVRDDLNLKRFYELDAEEQRHISLRTLRCIVILKESDPDIRFDVFERLNTNAVDLNPQELRNCIYRGKINDLAKGLSENSEFQYIRDVSEPDLRMKDVELILRFFAFYEQLSSYRGNLKKFLDNYQKSGMNRRDDEIAVLDSLFQRIVNDVRYIFDNKAFRRFDPKKECWEDSVNRAIYDSIMICFAKAESKEIRAKKHELISGLKQLCSSDDNFIDAVASATTHRNRVKNRLQIFREMMVKQGINVGEIAFWPEE